MMGRTWRIGGFWLLVAGCGENQNPPDAPGLEIVSYTGQIRPLLQEHCLSCHGTTVAGEARQGAPIDANFDTYPFARRNATQANRMIQSGVMAPADPLEETDRRLFLAWIAQGLRE